jgi:2,4-dienoyl-CoA reductase-like NADH-dependent reductase (Old Yellow Enzyme family)
MRRFDRGDFDLVAVGRALISDPDWVLKVRDGRDSELNDYSPAALASL